MRARKIRGTWIVDLLSAEEDTEALARWARRHGSFREREAGRRALALETGELPDAWEVLLDHPLVRAVRLAPDASAVLEARGPREHVEKLLDVFGPTAEVQSVRVATGEGAEEDPLTPTEQEALLRAYQAGYFAVPRRAQLSELADRMGKSSGWVSTLLRRAVGRIVGSYAEEGSSRGESPVEEDEE